MTTIAELVERAESLLEKTKKQRRKFFKVGQKSRRSNGEVFIKTARQPWPWRRVAKNPRKKPDLGTDPAAGGPQAAATGTDPDRADQPQSISDILRAAKTAYADAHAKAYAKWSGKGGRSAKSTDTAQLFGRPKKRKKTRSARPKPRRSSSTGSPKRWPEPDEP